jgi:hypothetical protein
MSESVEREGALWALDPNPRIQPPYWRMAHAPYRVLAYWRQFASGAAFRDAVIAELSRRRML